MNEWVKLKDRMPDAYVEVLVEVDGHRGPSWRNNHMLVAYMGHDGHFWEERHKDKELIGVTHWMPLPEPPKR